MSTTLVAVFDDNVSAAQACERLVAEQRIERNQLKLTSTAESSASRTDTDVQGGEPHGGGIRGFFARLFGVGETDEQAGHYAEAVRRGGAIVTVELADDAKADQAAALLEECGAIDIDDRVSRWKAEGYAGHDVSAPALSDEELARERQKFDVVREELKVGKRTVERGGLRVHRRVVETPVTEQVQLREQEAMVERVPVDRPATAADLEGSREQTLELRETTEEPVVEKTARVVEEVRVGLKESQRAETISDTVRRTDVEVERLDDGFERPLRSEQDVAGVVGLGSYTGPERRFNRQPYGGQERRASMMA